MILQENEIKTKTGKLKVLIHGAKTNKIAVIYPDFGNDNYKAHLNEISNLALALQKKRIAAISIIRESLNWRADKEQAPKNAVLSVIDFIKANAGRICGTVDYDIFLFAAGKNISGVCPIMGKYYQVKKVVLYAPENLSKEAIDGLSQYGGILSVISDNESLSCAASIPRLAKKAKCYLFTPPLLHFLPKPDFLLRAFY